MTIMDMTTHDQTPELTTAVADALDTTETAGCMSGIGLVRMITEIFLVLPIGLLGLCLNTLALIVLRKQKQRTTTRIYLMAVAITDNFILVSILMLNVLLHMSICFNIMQSYWEVFPFIFVVVYPCMFVARLAATWFMTLLTVDRWIAVCFPLHAPTWCNSKQAAKQIAVVLFMSALYSVPRFFEYKLTDKGGLVGFDSTDVMRDTYYTIIYRMVLALLISFLVPMILMLFFNIALLRAVRRSRALHCRMSVEGGRIQTPSVSEYRSITQIVLSVVGLFIVCNVFPLVSHLIWSLQESFGMDHLESLRRYASNISNVMVTLNSSVNFVVFMLCSKAFKDQVKSVCACRKDNNSNVRLRTTRSNFTWSSNQKSSNHTATGELEYMPVPQNRETTAFNPISLLTTQSRM